MAKRRTEKDEEEDKPFKFPKFDEEAFIKKEKRSIKSTFISFLFGCLMALICFAFWALMGNNGLRWPLVLLLMVASASFIRYIFVKLNIDLTEFGKKNWFGSYAIYFFTWLIVLIVLVNPPFYDDESPLIELIVLPDVQEPGGNVMVLAKITDNAGIQKSNIKFNLTFPDGSDETPDFVYANNVFEYTFDYSRAGPTNFSEDLTYNFKITVTDASGHTTSIQDTFKYSYNAIIVPEPIDSDTSPGPKVGYATTIKFDVNTQVSRVYYTVDGGNIINATKTNDEDYYTSSPKYLGWPKNKNITINVTAELIFYFENHIINGEFVEYKNTIQDAQKYYFVVTDDPNVATEKSPEIRLPGPRIVQAPGFELIVFLISLGVVVFIIKYRKKNSKQK